MNPLAIMMLASPVGAVGSGQGGGEEMTLRLAAAELSRRGHRVSVVAPRGSVVAAAAVVAVDGDLQPGAQLDGRTGPIAMPADPVIAHICLRARELAPSHDMILNFAYDWLPFYLTPFFPRPVAHWVLMASLSDAMDRVIGEVAARFPGSVRSCTSAQAKTFPCAHLLPPLGAGIDLAEYSFCAKPDSYLAWIGRISPEKGLEDAAAAARAVDMPLRVMGLVQDPEYLARVRSAYPGVIEHVGFLATPALQAVLRRASALLVTPRWVEALGLVVLEALACGVPVVAYRRGGPADIVREGETGWLVTPDSVDELAGALGRLAVIDRRACRDYVEREHDIRVVGDRIEGWLSEVAGR
jgi:UDP-glucose:tetrahydrobiopterin glucosyltransferase